ncbi:TFIIH C1-like domain containing protein [Trema orientale]|uniref:TFIIH C1-like domain containing protein n=1 Tax=Trema orientale TaxID=63057 RepID=A0A2P5F5H3_TREOI|nr:TFIIH C1-like domain containing protein [Trema orientale]
MERHRCKLCHRSFANGRALGGHMKAHLATLPLPPKTNTAIDPPSSSSYSSPQEEEEEEEEEVEVEEAEAEVEEEDKALAYGLRENPKKSFRLADPEFSFAVDAGSVIQDRESETESSRNPTRRRSKRNRRPFVAAEMKKAKLRRPSWVDSPAEPEPVSSVSDTSPEEDVAMCLMMLSRDVWMRVENEEQDHHKTIIRAVNGPQQQEQEEEQEIVKLKRVGAKQKHRCEKCNKVFRSHQAMCGHKKICFRNETEAKNAGFGADDKIFQCPYCYKVFGSGQALGGHKRSHGHQLNSATSTGAISGSNYSGKHREGLIDLNLPAPLEEDDFSVLSDA